MHFPKLDYFPQWRKKLVRTLPHLQGTHNNMTDILYLQQCIKNCTCIFLTSLFEDCRQFYIQESNIWSFMLAFMTNFEEIMLRHLHFLLIISYKNFQVALNLD